MSLFTLGTFLVLMLGANSNAAAGGPLAWLGFVRLPVTGGELLQIGPVLLLPVLSILAWIGYWLLTASHDQLQWQWGSPRIVIPLAMLWLWAIGRSGWSCFDGSCPRGAIARLIILAAIFLWVYLLIVNEAPDLLIVVAIIVVLQSTVAVGQFVSQGDLGLRALGELPLDPSISGISVVMRDGQRWLRGYGLTMHPNELARILAICLLLLVAWRSQPTRARAVLLAFVTIVGTAGMLVTLSRWAWVCLLLALTLTFLPGVREVLRTKRIGRPEPAMGVTAVALMTLILGFWLVYGSAITGRILDTGMPLESRSVNERQRDMNLAITLSSDSPLIGVGHGEYIAAARSIDPTAGIVHNVPLLVGAELGLGALTLWLVFLLAPLARHWDVADDLAPMAAFVAIGLMGLLYPAPYPLADTTSTLLVAIVAGYLTVNRMKSETQTQVNERPASVENRSTQGLFK